MRRTTVALLLALLAVGAAGSVTATAADTPPAAPSADGSTLVHAVDETAADGNLTVRVTLPKTVAANATQNYSVDVTGADGDVAVAWTFGDDTKRGQNVTHTWTDGGNATIIVTVTDGDGDSVTRELTVSVVDYGEDEDAGNPIDNIATIALFIGLLGGVPLVLLLFVVPKAMEVFTDAL